MANLTVAQRREVWADLMSEFSRRWDAITFSKADLLAAVEAVDGWVEANQASYNQAIPLPAQTNLTVAQKAELLMWVVEKRFKAGA